MALPSALVAGQVPGIAWLNAILAEQTAWTANKNGGGYNLTNLGDLTLAAGKIITAPGQPRCFVWASGALTLGTGTYTALSWDTEVEDVGPCHDPANPTRLVAPATGVYIAVGGCTFAAGGGTQRAVRWRKNADNAQVRAGVFLLPSASVAVGLISTSPAWSLTAGDYVELQAYQDSGGNLNTLSDRSYTWASLVKVA